MEFIDNTKRVINLYKLAGEVYDYMDIAITLDKMTAEQSTDLMAMIDYYENISHPESCNVLAHVHHDIYGIKEAILNPNGVHAKTFVPRSSGYAVKA